MNNDVSRLDSKLHSPLGIRARLRSLAGGPGYSGPRSDHFDGRRFFNPDATAGRSVLDVLRWQFTAERTAWPRWVVNKVHPSLPASLEAGEVALTFVNHITFLIQFAGLNVLTDPVYSQRASPFRQLGPRRVRHPGLAFEDLPPINVVLVTNNNNDHHAYACAALVNPRPRKPQSHALGRVHPGGERSTGLLRRRYRLLEALHCHPHPLRAHGSCATAYRGLQAALVHARSAYGSRRCRARAYRP